METRTVPITCHPHYYQDNKKEAGLHNLFGSTVICTSKYHRLTLISAISFAEQLSRYFLHSHVIKAKMNDNNHHVLLNSKSSI